MLSTHTTMFVAGNVLRGAVRHNDFAGTEADTWNTGGPQLQDSRRVLAASTHRQHPRGLVFSLTGSP